MVPAPGFSCERWTAVKEATAVDMLDCVAAGILLLDEEGSELHRTSRVPGLIEGTGLADPERLTRCVSSLAQRCHASVETEVETFEPIGTGGTGVQLSAAPLPEGGTIVTFEPLPPSEHVTERVRQFITQVTHDLRTPLTSILGASDLLLSGRVGEPEERHRNLLRIIGDGTGKMSELLSDLTSRFLETEVRS